MAEWATLKPGQGLRKDRISPAINFLPFLLGGLLARGSVLEMHPFGIAFAVALILNGKKGFLLGLFGVILGVFSLALSDLSSTIQILLIIVLSGVTIPYLRGRKHEGIYLGLITALITGVVAYLGLAFSEPNMLAAFKAVFLSALAGGFAIIFWYALSNQDSVWRGEFTKEQGMAWLLILIGVLSGLQEIKAGEINFSVCVLSFFILFVSQKYGAGSAAGVGSLLGFLPNLEFNVQNLMDAGLYGLAGYCTGAFQRFGKIGIGAAFSAVTLMLTVFLRPEAIASQLLSSALGLLLFLIWPGEEPRKKFLKPKPVPEVETTVSKVKTVAEIFNQIAHSFQAAEAEAYPTKPEIPELMNVLVERVCKTCPTMDVCWTREFYRTYHYLFNLFELVERQGQVDVQDLPPEWKRYCGRLKEILLGMGFIIEHEKNLEAWRARLANNQEAMSRQFQSVSQVIGHLAKELNARHNFEQVKPSSLMRHRRNYLDVGVASFVKSGNGISGDTYASLAFSPSQHAFIVSDGMGVGESAAKMSATALNLLEQLLSTGFDPEGAIQALNSILVLRSPEESFVTIDMAILDMESDNIKLIKVGASPAYIKGPEGVRTLTSSSLPAGILNQIEIPVIEEKLTPDDVLVLVTDGIQDVLKDGTDWLKGFLEKTRVPNSQELADEIVKEARRLSKDAMYDDGVVLVIRKIPN